MIVTIIDHANSAAARWAAWFVAATLDSAVLLVLVGMIWLAIRRRAAPWIGYCLFLLVPLKLLLPINISVPPELARWTPSVLASQWFNEQHDAVTQPARPSIELQSATAINTSSVQNRDLEQPAFVADSTGLPAGAAIAPRMTIVALFMLVWLTAVFFLMWRLVWIQLRFRSRLWQAKSIDEVRMGVDCRQLCRRARVTQVVSFVESDEITAPAVWGIFRPTIILPRQVWASLTMQQLRWVLLHELAHIRHRDLLIVAVQRCASILHFFNPTVWIANRIINRLREYACDDLATLWSESSAVESGQAFLEILRYASDGRSRIRGSLGVFGMDSKAVCMLRVRRLLDTERTIRVRVNAKSICAIILLAMISLPHLYAADKPVISVKLGIENAGDVASDPDSKVRSNATSGALAADDSAARILDLWSRSIEGLRSYDVLLHVTTDTFAKEDGHLVRVGEHTLRQRFMDRNWRVDLIKVRHIFRGGLKPELTETGADETNAIAYDIRAQQVRFFSSPQNFGQFQPLNDRIVAKLQAPQLYESFREQFWGQTYIQMLQPRLKDAKVSSDGDLVTLQFPPCSDRSLPINDAEYRFEIVLDSSKGYMPVLIRRSRQSGDSRVETTNDLTKTENGLWVPHKTTRTIYSKLGTGDLNVPLNVVVEELDMAQSNFNIAIDPVVFQLPFPPGTVVRDEFQHVNYIQANDGKKDFKAYDNYVQSGMHRPVAAPKHVPDADLPNRTISGRVSDLDGKPIADAEVWLPVHWVSAQKILTAHANCGHDGKFELVFPAEWVPDDLTQIHSTVWAYAPGHSIGIGKVFDQLRDQKMDQPCEIQLGPPSDTKFTVLLPDGQPAAGVHVQPDQFRGSQGYEPPPPELLAKTSATTDQQGHASLATYPLEKILYLGVKSEELGSQQFQLLQQPRNSQSELELLPVGRVEGRVLADQKELFQDMVISIETEGEESRSELRSGKGIASSRVDHEGRFVIPHIAAGAITVDAITDRRLPMRPRLPERHRFAVAPGKTTQLEIPLETAVQSHGVVRKKGSGEPVAGAIFNVGYGVGRQSDRVKTDAAGKYTAYILPGQVRVEAIYIPHGNLVVYSPPQNGSDRFYEPRTLRFSVPDGVAEFELPPIDLTTTKKVTGHLLASNGKPLPNCRINGVIGNARYGWGESDKNGEFTLSEVPEDVTLVQFEVWTDDLGLRIESTVETTEPLVVRVR